MRLRHRLLAVIVLLWGLVPAAAQTSPPHPTPHWATSWTGSVQGPYPVGNPSAQPDLRFAFPQTPARATRPCAW